ncbi:FtsX-like permease family protein [Parashewanella curva]|uniref:FtsX-like permease family protein n=1 Tax=Parashewanella curva TaxID=2338552 RepID=A0A3L8Q3B7_9GAMM|nr:ABC transporter permease [Parashewanella curva]RLV61689.1 FtsX-like permease family protein [Parashewanella curva]
MFLHYLDLAWRSIRKTPALSLLMVTAIAIGIGITTTTLNIYQMMALNPTGERSEQLHAVQLWSHGPDTWDEFHMQITYQDAMNLRNLAPQFKQLAQMRSGMVIQVDSDKFEPELRAVRVTDSDFFSMFSVPFLYGTSWGEQVDKDAAYHVVISEKYNQKMFGGGDNVGKTVYLNRKPYQVVGIVDNWNPQPKFFDPMNGAFRDAEEVFVPFSLLPIEKFQVWGNISGWKHEDTKNFSDTVKSEKVWIQYWVELNSQESRQQYKQILTGYIDEQKALGRFTDNKTSADSSRLNTVAQWLSIAEVIKEDNRILVGLSFLFLSVCLVNILGLILTKFLKRTSEVGVRRAIGASRMHIFSQYMVEVGIIGLLGGLVGLALASGMLYLLGEKFGMDSSLISMSNSMWFIAPFIAIMTTLVAGIFPAWKVCHTKPSVYLKSQ